MTRLLFLLALLFASGATAAQGALSLRLDESEMDDGGISFAGLVRGLHVLAPEAEDTQEIVLFSALVVDGEVLARGRSEFIAMGIDDELPEGVTLRDSRIELDRRYAARRAETPMAAQILMPSLTEEPESIPGGDMFFPGEMLFPGEMHFPGDLFFPGEMLSPEAEAPLAIPGDQFISGRSEVDPRRGASDRDLVRAAERADREAARSGEPMIVFFAARPDGGSVSEIAVLRKRPGR